MVPPLRTTSAWLDDTDGSSMTSWQCELRPTRIGVSLTCMNWDVSALVAVVGVAADSTRLSQIVLSFWGNEVSCCWWPAGDDAGSSYAETMRWFVPFLVCVAVGCSGSDGSSDAIDKAGGTVSTEVVTEPTLKPTTTTAAPTTTSTTTTTIPQVDVPDVSNYDKDVALTTLNDLGLRGVLEPVGSREAEDSVIRIDPRPGTSLDPGSTVVLEYAVPLVHDVTVSYSVEEPTWLNRTPGFGPCVHRDYDVVEGQSVLLIGPRGEILGSTAVSNGGPGYHPDFREPCVFEFVFPDIPEVATYELETPDGSRFPAYSLSEAIDYDWYLSWQVDYTYR